MFLHTHFLSNTSSLILNLFHALHSGHTVWEVLQACIYAQGSYPLELRGFLRLIRSLQITEPTSHDASFESDSPSAQNNVKSFEFIYNQLTADSGHCDQCIELHFPGI